MYTSNLCHKINTYRSSDTRTEASNSASKKIKLLEEWDRHVICIPNTFLSQNEARGQSLAYLARNGLIGKLHLTSAMNNEEIILCVEIRSIFAESMGYNDEFQFSFLQPAGGGGPSH
jgi:hypothetical protein